MRYHAAPLTAITRTTVLKPIVCLPLYSVCARTVAFLLVVASALTPTPISMADQQEQPDQALSAAARRGDDTQSLLAQQTPLECAMAPAAAAQDALVEQFRQELSTLQAERDAAQAARTALQQREAALQEHQTRLQSMK